MPAKALSIFDREILSQAVVESFKKLNPLKMLKNPVMFVTEVGAAMTTASIIFGPDSESLGFGFQIAVWLWFTVLFANFAEAVAEGRGKAQANALRKTRTQTIAHRLLQDGLVQQDIPADKLRKGDEVVVSAGETIPADGEVIQGVASVDESAI
ncbi:MAG: P-type ATPase, partial [Desulfomonilaceae bacterium]